MAFIDNFDSWEDAERAWGFCDDMEDVGNCSEKIYTPSISRKTLKFLEFKALWYLLFNDNEDILLPHVCENFFSCSLRYVKSLFVKSAVASCGDLFFYGIDGVDFFKNVVLKDCILFLGFSYCSKPFKCPCGRFSEKCFADLNCITCRRCFIGKVRNFIPSNSSVVFSILTTSHQVGHLLFSIVKDNPCKKVLFAMTSCELALNMFKSWREILGIKGVGIRLRGNVCNTFKAFENAENGIKPVVTQISLEGREFFLKLLKTIYNTLKSR